MWGAPACPGVSDFHFDLTCAAAWKLPCRPADDLVVDQFSRVDARLLDARCFPLCVLACLAVGLRACVAVGKTLARATCLAIGDPACFLCNPACRPVCTGLSVQVGRQSVSVTPPPRERLWELCLAVLFRAA